MLNGDSEVQIPVRVSPQDQIALAVKHHQAANDNGSKPRSASFSSFSDSAHVPTQYRPQLPADDSSDVHSRSNGFSTTDSVQSSSVRSSPVRSSPLRNSPIRAPPPPLNGLATTALPVILDNQQTASPPPAPSILEQPQVGLEQQAEQAEPASSSCWRSNEVCDRDKPSNSSYRASQSLPMSEVKSFMSVDKSLTAHWRAKALEGLDDRSSVDSKDSARHKLPAVAGQDPEPQQGTLPALLQRLDYEHELQAAQIPTHQQQQDLQQQVAALNPLHTAPAQMPVSAQQPQSTSQQQQESAPSSQAAVSQSQPKLSNNPIYAPEPEISSVAGTDIITSVPVSRYVGQSPEPLPGSSTHAAAAKGYVGPPASRAIHYTSRPSSIKSTPSRYISDRTEALSPSQHAQQSPLLQPSPLQGVPEHLHLQQQQQQQSDHTLTQPQAEDFEELDLTAQHQAVDDLSSDLDQLYPLHPVQPSLPSLLIESNLEAVRARSTMLDIPSAELLDSILDFANAVCGEQPNDNMFTSEVCHNNSPALLYWGQISPTH